VVDLRRRGDTLWVFSCVRFLSVRLVCGGVMEPVEVCGYVVEFI